MIRHETAPIGAAASIARSHSPVRVIIPEHELLAVLLATRGLTVHQMVHIARNLEDIQNY